MKKIVFIGSLNTKKQRFDGERIKTTFLKDSLNKYFDLTTVDLSKHKLLSTLRIVLLAFFGKTKYEKIIISKDPRGANIIMLILRFANFPLDKIIYFEIGPFLYDRVKNGSIKKETFAGIDIIVETDSMKRELLSVGFNKVIVFPNFKPFYSINLFEKEYPVKVLKLIYFSRICEKKGIYDLIDCVRKLNTNGVIVELDIFGLFDSKDDEKRICKLVNEVDGIKYCGKLDIKGPNEYELLSKYDLHVFPTKYSEGFPGTIIDFFIAGVPTLCSTFERANDILSNSESYFFIKEDKEDLFNQIKYIYNNQKELVDKRKNAFSRRREFSVERFEEFICDYLSRS